jgi:hypothetical protein
MAETAVTHVLLDPASPIGSRTLYACGFGRGVFKSVDNGMSWTLKNVGVEKEQPFAWRLVRANDGTLYLVVASRSEDGSIANAQDGALVPLILALMRRCACPFSRIRRKSAGTRPAPTN